MKGGVTVPIFLPYAGCKRRCVFCDQHAATGVKRLPSFEEMDTIYDVWTFRGEVREIAFYGGTITGLDKERLVSYLSWAYSKLGKRGYIRISTRPDEIDEEVISILQEFGVRHVEIGVQSFSDKVLKASNRGHSAEDSVRAIQLLKASGFIVGAHLMIGLPGSSVSDERFSAQRLTELGVDTCRLHPTLIFKDTPLYEMTIRGDYTPLSLEEAVDRTSVVYALLRRSGVHVIRIGLFLEPQALERLAAGPYHPALGHMVKSLAFYRAASEIAKDEARLEIIYSRRFEPVIIGYRRWNVKNWKERGWKLSLKTTDIEGVLNVNGEDLRWVV